MRESVPGGLHTSAALARREWRPADGLGNQGFQQNEGNELRERVNERETESE